MDSGIGKTIKVTLLPLTECGSTGIVTDYRPECDWWYVKLHREQPPFRGIYQRNEFEFIKEES